MNPLWSECKSACHAQHTYLLSPICPPFNLLISIEGRLAPLKRHRDCGHWRHPLNIYMALMSGGGMLSRVVVLCIWQIHTFQWRTALHSWSQCQSGLLVLSVTLPDTAAVGQVEIGSPLRGQKKKLTTQPPGLSLNLELFTFVRDVSLAATCLKILVNWRLVCGRPTAPWSYLGL